jgi:hypothetical protein
VQRGNAAAAMLHGSSSREDQWEVEAFEQLKTAGQLLLAERRKDHSTALQALAELPFIPQVPPPPQEERERGGEGSRCPGSKCPAPSLSIFHTT